MNQKESFPRRSILNWLGLGLIGLLMFGLLRLTQDDQPAAELQEASVPASVTQDLSSPLPAALLSPMSPSQESPLPGALTATLAPTAPSSLLPSPTAVPESPVAAPSPTAPPPAQPVGSDHFHLTVLHTNDTWGYLNPCGWRPPTGGVARRATVINQEREQAGFLLVLDAGDSLTGDQPPAQSTLGRTSVTAMNMMGYDAMALGGQDLALSLPALRQRIAEAEFAILSANAVVSPTGELVATPYLLHQFDGHTVAIVGLSEDSGTRDIAVRDPLVTAREIVAQLSTQADVIILLSHAGPLVDQQIAEAVPGIDLVISGGKFTSDSPWRSEKTGTLLLHADAASPGHAGRRIGIARLTFDQAGQLVDQSWQRLDLVPEVASDTTMLNWVREQLAP